MSVAWISLAALVAAVTLSIVSKVNVGVVSLALAWIVGVYIGDMTYNAVIGTFPVALFITLAGVTLLFGMANVNGTLQRLAARAVSAVPRQRRRHPGDVLRGRAVPVVDRPGQHRHRGAAGADGHGGGRPGRGPAVPHRADARQRRPGRRALAVCAHRGHRQRGDGPHWPGRPPVGPPTATTSWPTSSVTFVAYLLFGGWKLFASHRSADGAEAADAEPFEGAPLAHPGVLAAVVLGVILFNLQVGMAALVGATILSLARAGDEKEAIKRMPWGVVLMVCGVTVLIGVLEKTQGMSLFTDLLATVSSPDTVSAVVAFATGLVSVYSSTSGVVLPAFLPTVPGLVERLGGGDPMAIASSMVVGGHLVDLSPLSTIGALCIAALPAGTDGRQLFNQLLAWGMSMVVVGTAVCWILF